MKKSILTTILFALIGISSFAAQAPGDTNKVSHNVKIIASSVLDINMTSSADVVFEFKNSTDYESGITKSNAAELKVKSTKPWTIVVSTTATNFDALDNANDSEVAASKLEVRKNGAASSVAVNSGSSIATGTKGGRAADGNTFSIDYVLNPGYIAQDTYVIPVTYTISQQ